MSHSDPYTWSSTPWSLTIEHSIDNPPRVTSDLSMVEDDLSRNKLSHNQDMEWEPTEISPEAGGPLVMDVCHATSHDGSQPGGSQDRSTGPFLPTPSFSNMIYQEHSLFSGAHNFTIRDSVMITKEIKREKKEKLLEKKAFVDATYNSAARHDTAPRCHPDTRVMLRERAIVWLLDTDREESLFWLYGPAGVGKSAIAQRLMEYCEEHNFPGAGLFLSRANKRNDPNRIIPSLAHQLALAHPAYRRAITDVLSADSTILEKRLPLQFQLLIDRPADVFKLASGSNVASNPILLLLDGLDECNTESAQRELIRLIADFASRCTTQRLPFVCVITSRPEWQTVSTFDKLGSNVQVWQEELPMDTPEARRDVEKVLRAGFEQIRNKRDDAFSRDTEWPARVEFRRIMTAASGNMLFASLVVDFIDDDDPSTRLEDCLMFLQGKLTSERNPLDPLSALCQGMLRSIPPNLLRPTLLILYLHLLNNGHHIITAQMLATFFHVDRPTFYECFRKLHSVIKVPQHFTDSLKFSHTTFADYVKVAIQTGSFGLCEIDAVEYMGMTCIQWHGKLKEHRDEEYLPGIILPLGGNIENRILQFSRNFLFELWNDLFHQNDVAKLQEELRHFRFKDLPRGVIHRA